MQSSKENFASKTMPSSSLLFSDAMTLLTILVRTMSFSLE